MSARRAGQRRGGQPTRRYDPDNVWRSVPAPEPQEPIRPVSDPSALIDSLGPPPLGSRSAVAQHYLAAVVERAATVATALAASAGILADGDTSET